MTSFFPTDPKKIRERIKRYERAFKEPHHDDGAGKRFLLGQLYMLMGDLEGALKSYIWYKKTFPDDIPEAFNHLCWTLALLRSGDEKAAKAKLRELVFDNVKLIAGPEIIREGFLPESVLPEMLRQNPSPQENINFPDLATLEKKAIEEALLLTGGNKRQSAALLGISERTLYRMLR